jgi:hypothetical protein
MTPLEANRSRWSGAAGHYEVWFATLSHAPSRTGFWIRYTLESPQAGHGPPFAQLWFACFDAAQPDHTFGIHRTFPVRELITGNQPFRVRVGDAELRMDGMRGELAGAGHSAAWDLRWAPSEQVIYHFPDLAYRGTWSPTKVLAPQPNLAARGSLTVDGRTYEIDGAPLGQSHVWGRKHSYAWAWSHCNGFIGDRGALLESTSGHLKRGPIVLPNLTLFTLDLEGSQPSRLDFHRFRTLAMTRSEYGTGRYWMRATGLLYRVDAELTSTPENTIQAEYVDPDGEPVYCHYTGCADARVRIEKRTPFGWREVRTLRADKTAHFEWAARAGDPLVRKRHVHVDG